LINCNKCPGHYLQYFFWIEVTWSSSSSHFSFPHCCCVANSFRSLRSQIYHKLPPKSPTHTYNPYSRLYHSSHNTFSETLEEPLNSLLISSFYGLIYNSRHSIHQTKTEISKNMKKVRIYVKSLNPKNIPSPICLGFSLAALSCLVKIQ
jgi:hypothetical protein